VRQRTQLINAIRGHLTEYGWVAPKGPSHVTMLADLLEEEEMASSLPEAARAMFRLMLDLLAGLDGKIADLDKEIARRAREDEVSRRLMTVPGIGPISATAIAALAPPAETFAKGRDFAAWLGLTPLQRSTGGKQKLGATSKMGERTLRRLLIIGSSAVVLQASKRGAPKGSWRTDAGSQTAHAGDRRARQQDGAAASDYVPIFFKNRLHLAGRPQMSTRMESNAWCPRLTAAMILSAPVRHTVIAILRPAYPPSAKMRSMNGNSRRARRSKWKAPS
jgi:transposase